MLEFPKCSVGVSSVKDISFYWSVSAGVWDMRLFNQLLTFMETIHVKLSHKGGNVGVLEILPAGLMSEIFTRNLNRGGHSDVR